MKDTPQINPDLVIWLQRTFVPVTDTRGVDLREIDFRSGQFSVVEHLKAISERQKRHGSERT